MTDNTDYNNQQAMIAKAFQKMLLAIGSGLEKTYKITEKEMTPDERGDLSSAMKPIMKVGKQMFETMLNNNFDSSQLGSLFSMFNKKFLNGMKEGVSGKDQSPIALAIQLLMNIGIPMIKNLIGHAAKHHKKEDDKVHDETHPALNNKNKYVPKHKDEFISLKKHAQLKKGGNKAVQHHFTRPKKSSHNQ